MRWLGLVVVAGCGIDEGGLLQLNDAAVPVDALADVTPKDASVDTTDSAVVDVIPEAPPPPSCNISTKPFGAPTNLGANVNTTEAEWLPWLTDDELTVYFTRAMGMNVSSLYFATRALPTDTFGPAQQILLDRDRHELRHGLVGRGCVRQALLRSVWKPDAPAERGDRRRDAPQQLDGRRGLEPRGEQPGLRLWRHVVRIDVRALDRVEPRRRQRKHRPLGERGRHGKPTDARVSSARPA